MANYTLQTTIDYLEAQYSSRLLLYREQILDYIQVIQNLAFNKDLPYFIKSEYITTLDDTVTYDAPEGCRKIYGVTTLTDLELAQCAYEDDKWLPVNIDNFTNEITFLSQPIVDASTYRVFYYQDAPLIEDEDDDDNFLIPQRFRFTLVIQGVIALAKNALALDSGIEYLTPEQTLKPYLDTFWDSVSQANAPTGINNNRTIGFI